MKTDLLVVLMRGLCMLALLGSNSLKAQVDTIYQDSFKDCKGVKPIIVELKDKKFVTLKIDGAILSYGKFADKDIKSELEAALKKSFNLSCSDAAISSNYQELLLKLPHNILSRIKKKIEEPTEGISAKVWNLDSANSLIEIQNIDDSYTYTVMSKSVIELNSNLPILTYKDGNYVFNAASINKSALVRDSIVTILNIINSNKKIKQPSVYLNIDSPSYQILLIKEQLKVPISPKFVNKIKGVQVQDTIAELKGFSPKLGGKIYKVNFLPLPVTVAEKAVSGNTINREEVIALIENRIKSIADEDGDAASIELKGELVELHSEQSECDCNLPMQLLKLNGKYLKIEYVKFDTYNNALYLNIVGTIDGVQINPIINTGWGLKLASLMNNGGSMPVKLNGKTYYLQFCELFKISPVVEPISYEFQDESYIIKPGGGAVLKRRQLIDLISASAFIDPFGLNDASAKAPITAELYASFYLNRGRRSWLRTVNVMATVTSDYLRSKDNFVETQFVNYNQFTYREIDFLKHINFSFRPLLNIVTINAANLNLLVEFNTGGQVSGANFRQVYLTKAKTDSTVYNNLSAYTGVFQTRFKVADHKSRFGFDLQVNYLTGYRLFDDRFKGLRGDHPLAVLTSEDFKSGLGNILDIDFNIFIQPKKAISKINRGGIYIKTKVSKALGYKSGFFAFMLGYSTDIQNFFK
ncbi:hypothetical protein [Pedobacter duraquae]|uniref:Uncharacterized protein n=1 Tax=Pedobacter duraquae TaxID=425511 RepID=A0A4R6IDI1_9SPHI|nr:hypothetical protein [Pedobacter duraquae]TDO20323.1 hypothetical protein CLV32_4083 [Pedobacter duraquae]